MDNLEKRLREADRRLLEQRREYTEAGIPIDFSPKTLILILEGFERRLLSAVKEIERISLKVTDQAPSPSSFGPGIGDSIILAVPTLHFDFEEAEADLIKLMSEAITTRERVKLRECIVRDTFENIDTVRPLEIPHAWLSCIVQGIPVVGIDRSPLGDPKKTGFTIMSTLEGTKIENLNDPSIDPRLTRYKLYKLLRDIVEGTKERRTDLVDIEFETESHA